MKIARRRSSCNQTWRRHTCAALRACSCKATSEVRKNFWRRVWRKSLEATEQSWRLSSEALARHSSPCGGWRAFCGRRWSSAPRRAGRQRWRAGRRSGSWTSWTGSRWCPRPRRGPCGSVRCCRRRRNRQRPRSCRRNCLRKAEAAATWLRTFGIGEVWRCWGTATEAVPRPPSDRPPPWPRPRHRHRQPMGPPSPPKRCPPRGPPSPPLLPLLPLLLPAAARLWRRRGY
mmetsp:Transcript_77106/g.249583  ORF Transcript_77106/g.249583 Transcript_77106/m.249583 type:complete len:230 (+) Transcript_77106:970-1659(+)